MKKIYTLVAGLLLAGTVSKAQDTVMYESFNYQSFYDNYLSQVVAPPPGVTSDTLWYSWDQDGLADGSGGNREPGWFGVQPFAYVDTTNNVAIGANSWFSSPAAAANWLITPSITLRDHDTLFWKSAPSQTPRYLDGYKVLISTTINDDAGFAAGATLFTAAEMTAILGTNDSVFSGYSFSSPGFVHGLDGTFTEYRNDSARLHGILRPMSIPLDAYAGQTVFFAFFHDSFDDNLISIDDFMVRGEVSVGVKENKSDLGLNLFPNPAFDYAQVNFNLTSETPVVISVYDVTGKVVYSENKGSMANGRHFAKINTAALANGFYTVAVQTNAGRSTAKLLVK